MTGLSKAPRTSLSVTGASTAALLAVTFATAWIEPAEAARRSPYSRQETKPLRQQQQAAKQPAAKAQQQADQPLAGPVTIVVSVGSQRLSVYDGNQQVAQAPVSTGQRGHETPMGVFSVIGKERMHHSNIYNGAPMPFMQRITWSGVALHAGVLPGYPASHGCIRMPFDFARKLYGLTKMGARVIVSKSDTQPVEIAHSKLFTTASLQPRDASVQTATTASVGAPMRLGAPTEAEAGAANAPADTTAPAKERATNSLLRKAQERAQKTAEDVQLAHVAKTQAAEKLPEATRAAHEARDAAAAGRAEIARAAANLKRLEAEQIAINGQLAQLGKRANAENDLRAAESEDRLEARFLALTDEIETARAELKSKQDHFAPQEEKAQTAEAAHRAAVRAHDDAIFGLRIAEDNHLTAQRDVARRQQPITMLVSRKTGKIHVRQANEPLIELPVTVSQADQPIGTHVFTALPGSDGKASVRWNVVTMPGAATANDTPQRGKRRGEDAPPVQQVSHAGTSPAAALDRVQFTPEIIEQLGELMKPGSTLIVSDQGVSHETGKATDIIVLTR